MKQAAAAQQQQQMMQQALLMHQQQQAAAGGPPMFPAHHPHPGLLAAPQVGSSYLCSPVVTPFLRLDRSRLRSVGGFRRCAGLDLGVPAGLVRVKVFRRHGSCLGGLRSFDWIIRFKWWGCGCFHVAIFQSVASSREFGSFLRSERARAGCFLGYDLWSSRR